MRAKGGDFFCNTGMCRRENVECCTPVAMVYRAALVAKPFFCQINDPASSIFQTFRARAILTTATGQGEVRFVDVLKPHACDIAFVLQQGASRTPAGIQTDLAWLVCVQLVPRQRNFWMPGKSSSIVPRNPRR